MHPSLKNHPRLAHSLVGQDNRLSPDRPGFESPWANVGHVRTTRYNNPYRTRTQTSSGHTKAKVHGGMCHRGDKALSVERVSRPFVLDDLASPKDARGTG